MASKRSKPTAKPRSTAKDPNRPRDIHLREIDPETFRLLAEGRASQGLESWLTYFVNTEKLRRVVTEDARQPHVTQIVSKARAYCAAAGLLFPGSG